MTQLPSQLTAALPNHHARYANAFVGLAAGDAWGYQVEFISYSRMPAYPVAPPAGEWEISDDTQMTLALHDALEALESFEDVEAVTAAILGHFQTWKADPDNNRAPGNTCMGSLSNLRTHARWWEPGGAFTSAGCGAVMRLVPTAFAPDRYWLGLTALQAVITHNHPRAVIPSLLLAEAIRYAPERHGTFLERALETAAAIRNGTSAWITDPYLLRVLAPVTSNLQQYLIDGLDDGTEEILRNALERKQELEPIDPASWGDPCTDIGEGWESASAIALALLAADMGTTRIDGPAALGWAATSNGDSDSIASIAGAIIGAAHTEPNYWASVDLSPQFEPRYAREIGAIEARIGLAEESTISE